MLPRNLLNSQSAMILPLKTMPKADVMVDIVHGKLIGEVVQKVYGHFKR